MKSVLSRSSILCLSLMSIGTLSFYSSSHGQTQVPNSARYGEGGSHGGNGGSNIEIDFKDYGLKFYRFLITSEGKQLFPEIDVEKLKEALQAEVEVVRYALKDRDGKLKTCINLNLNGESLIRINRKAWREDSRKPVTQLRNAVHEYLGVAGIGGDAERLNYVYSLRINTDIAMKILISGPAASTQQVAPLEASEALLAEAEIRRQKEKDEELTQRAAAEADDIKKSWEKELNLASIRTIRCVEKMLKRQLGGKYSADYAVASLQSLKDARARASLERDLTALTRVAEHCEATTDGLRREKTDRWSVIGYAKVRMNETQNPLYAAVEAFLKPKVDQCIDRSVNASAALLGGFKAGVGGTVCTLTNGQRYLSVGVNLGGGFGIGASLEATQTKISGDDFIPRQYQGDESYHYEQAAKVFGGTRMVGISVHVDSDGIFILDQDTWHNIQNALKSAGHPAKKDPPGNSLRKDRTHQRYGVGAGLSTTMMGGIRVPLIPLKKDYSYLLKML